MIHQMHWQFRDGTTELKAQKDVEYIDDMRVFVRDTRKEFPLPDGAMWLTCNKESKHFVGVQG